MGILDSVAFVARSTMHTFKGYITGQLLFVQETILLINQTAE